MALPDWELNLFSADPRLLQPQDDRYYDRAARAVSAIGSTTRLKLLHALLVGERTAERAASWAGVPRARVEAELRDLEARGVIAREDEPGAPAYRPCDGHVVVQVMVALAHGRHAAIDDVLQPLLLRERRAGGAGRRRGQ